MGHPRDLTVELLAHRDGRLEEGRGEGDKVDCEKALAITPARKFRMLLHINPTCQRGKRTGSLARASGWYMTFFAAGVIIWGMRLARFMLYVL